MTLYLDVKATVCHHRIHKLRGRDCESVIALSYLLGLENHYQAFVEQMKNCGSRIISINWNQFGSSDAIVSAILNAKGCVVDYPQNIHDFVRDAGAVRDTMTLSTLPNDPLPDELGGEDKDEHTQLYKMSEKCLYIESVITIRRPLTPVTN